MTQVTMPQLGESVTEGTITKWMKQPGDSVALDDSLCEIETEKVTAELPSAFEGTMGQIHVQEGETVEVGTLLCEIEQVGGGAGTATAPDLPLSQPQRERGQGGEGWRGGPMAIPPDEDSSPSPSSAPPAAARREATAVATPPRPAVADRVAGSPEERSKFYSPAVLRLAREHDLDLSSVQGTGIGGRITRRDVERLMEQPDGRVAAKSPAPAAPQVASPSTPSPAAPAAARGAAPGDYEVRTFTPTRKAIAANMTRSNLEAPQAWLMVEADVTGLVRLREQQKAAFAESEGVELTLLPYFTLAVCETLREVPAFNARWEGDELRQYRDLNIGIAIAAPTGLVVPVIHGAGDLSIAGLARRIADLAARARDRKLRIEDIEGGTFTVNNTGAFGSIASKPIVNYPQVAIVTMERAVKRPIVTADDAIAIRSMMNICFSFDHRIADGLEAGQFVTILKRKLEAHTNPQSRERQ